MIEEKIDNSYKIQAVKESEVEKLQMIALMTFRHTYEHLNHQKNFEQYIRDQLNTPHLLEQIKNPESHFYFFEQEGVTKGYFKLNWGNSQTEKMQETNIEIERIYVHPQHQRQGIGSKMMKFIESLATQKGFKEVWLGVWTKNLNAVKFYKNQGYIIRDEHIFKIGEDNQNDYIMVKEI